MKLSDAMREKMLLSFELFPPKTEKGMTNLPGTIEHLMKYKPEYISCTYGAGGGNVGANREVCQMIRNAGTIPVTHFTVIKNTKEGIKKQLQQYLAEGVDHMLALRGDIPLGETTTCGDFNYATDLVRFVRDEFGDKFEIAVAGSPEGHIACRSLDADIAVLRQKQDNGADYIMTQLCWDMEQFKYWLDANQCGKYIHIQCRTTVRLSGSHTPNHQKRRNTAKSSADCITAYKNSVCINAGKPGRLTIASGCKNLSSKIRILENNSHNNNDNRCNHNWHWNRSYISLIEKLHYIRKSGNRKSTAQQICNTTDNG